MLLSEFYWIRTDRVRPSNGCDLEIPELIKVKFFDLPTRRTKRVLFFRYVEAGWTRLLIEFHDSSL